MGPAPLPLPRLAERMPFIAGLFLVLAALVLLLAFLGGAAGVILGAWASDAVSSIPVETNIPVLLDFSFDWKVYAYAFGTALFTGFAVGAWPTWRASRADVSAALDGSWLRPGPSPECARGHRLCRLRQAAYDGVLPGARTPRARSSRSPVGEPGFQHVSGILQRWEHGAQSKAAPRIPASSLRWSFSTRSIRVTSRPCECLSSAAAGSGSRITKRRRGWRS